jgi:DNA-binding CsgD family transcriptional regulator
VDEALAWLAEERGTADREPGRPEGVRSDADPIRAQPHADRPGEALSETAPQQPGPAALTPREREIAALIGRGLTSREIAERLVIGRGTADAHADHIREKLGVRSRAEIAAWAVRHGLLGLQPPSGER